MNRRKKKEIHTFFSALKVDHSFFFVQRFFNQKLDKVVMQVSEKDEKRVSCLILVRLMRSLHI